MGAYTLTLFDNINAKPLWADAYDDMELVAGLLAAGTSLVNTINETKKLAQYTFQSNMDLNPFLVHRDIREDDLNKTSCNALNRGEYGIWLLGSRVGRYHLYRFRKSAFMQGMVSMFTGFQVDFRDYLWGLPFNWQLKKLIMYGYIMTSDQMAIDTPDLDDVDLEEADDENVIEPLTKDYGEDRY
jgi:hypothetical protein